VPVRNIEPTPISPVRPTTQQAPQPESISESPAPVSVQQVAETTDAKISSPKPLDKVGIRTMSKTYHVPIEKLARRRGYGRHTLLIVLLLALVVGVGIAALLLTDTLSI
jgi:hypothetical protein